jgi:hypothetical protein
MSKNKSDAGLWSHLQFPFGYPAAIDNLGTTAAPLLAGFAFALIGLTLDKKGALGEPDLALLLLVVASIALVSSVQFNFKARSFHFSPGEYFEFQRLAAEDSVPLSAVKDMAAEYLLRQKAWAAYCRLAYNFGVAVLFFGVASTLIPTAGIGHMAPLRAAAVTLITLAGLVESGLIAWEAISSLRYLVEERYF